MSIWDAALSVGTGLSLVAFVVAAALLAYRARLKARAATISEVPPGDRLAAIEAIAEYLRVDISGLSAKDKHDIVVRQIENRAKRDLLYAQVALLIAFLLAAVAIVQIATVTRNSSPVPRAGSSDPPALSTPAVTPVATIEYRVCRGERQLPSYCPPGAFFLTCGDSIEDWAKKKCATFAAKQTYSTHGGMCGYETVTVTCKAPL